LITGVAGLAQVWTFGQRASKLEGIMQVNTSTLLCMNYFCNSEICS